MKLNSLRFSTEKKCSAHNVQFINGVHNHVKMSSVLGSNYILHILYIKKDESRMLIDYF